MCWPSPPVGFANASTLAVVGARVAALEAELRAKDAALQASKLQTSQWSAGCTNLRQQLINAEQSIAEASELQASAEKTERSLRVELAEARTAAANAEEMGRFLQTKLALATSEAAHAQSCAEVAESRLEAMVSIVDSVHQEVAEATALPEAALQAAAAAAGRVTAAAVSRSNAACLWLFLLLWSAGVHGAAPQRKGSKTGVAAAMPTSSPGACRTAVVRLLGGAVGRYWRVQRKLVLELWRSHAREAAKKRFLNAQWAQCRVFEMVVNALLAATQDAWWLHTIIGSWKNLVCAQALERVFNVVAVDGTAGGRSGAKVPYMARGSP